MTRRSAAPCVDTRVVGRSSEHSDLPEGSTVCRRWSRGSERCRSCAYFAPAATACPVFRRRWPTSAALRSSMFVAIADSNSTRRSRASFPASSASTWMFPPRRRVRSGRAASEASWSPSSIYPRTARSPSNRRPRSHATSPSPSSEQPQNSRRKLVPEPRQKLVPNSC